MDTVISEILAMSLSGSILILAAMLIRLVLKKAPKSAICLLWLLAGLRLTVPFHIESDLSLQPELPSAITQQSPSETQPEMVPAIPDVGELPDDVEISVSDDAVIPEQSVVIDYTAVAAVIWLTGIAGLWLYSLVTWLGLKRRVKTAVIHSEGVWISGSIDTAFVLGLFRPRIYLPAGMDTGCYPHILAHERSHIRRGDHWWKLLGFGVLSVHWFNPLVWAAYMLLCRDIEIACDERVVKRMDAAERKSYSAALLSCSAGHKGIAACPVAFSETSVKVRIQNVLNYKKPSFWLLAACVVALVFVAVCLLTTPPAEDLLGLCRQALEYHQAEAAKKITVVTEFSGTNVPEYPIEHTYWRYGENYLVKWYIDDGNHLPGWLLKTNGETYCNGIGPYYPEGITDHWSWAVTDKIPEEDFTDWLDEYQWNAEDITLIKTEKVGGNTLVTFTVAQESTDTYGGTADHRILTFCLDGDGKLIYVQRETTTSGIYEGEAYSSTTVAKSYVSYDEDSIRGMIMGRISEIPAPH